MTESRTRLDQPRGERRGLRRPRFDAEAFGSAAESMARYFGTARYLSIQSIFVAAWIAYNVIAIKELRFDKYPFILLNLAFSTQAAYAAPLILLAQNRQADRDKVQAQADRDEAQQSKADLDYLAREIAAIRMALGEVATRDFLRSELSRAQDAGEARDRRRKEPAPAGDGEERTGDVGSGQLGTPPGATGSAGSPGSPGSDKP